MHDKPHVSYDSETPHQQYFSHNTILEVISGNSFWFISTI